MQVMATPTDPRSSLARRRHRRARRRSAGLSGRLRRDRAAAELSTRSSYVQVRCCRTRLVACARSCRSTTSSTSTARSLALGDGSSPSSWARPRRASSGRSRRTGRRRRPVPEARPGHGRAAPHRSRCRRTQAHVVVSAGALTRRSRPIVDTPNRITDLALTGDRVVFVADGFVGVMSRGGERTHQLDRHRCRRPVTRCTHTMPATPSCCSPSPRRSSDGRCTP